MVLCVSLNTTKDIVVPVKSFIRGSVLRTNSVLSYPAGKAINSARALSTLGADIIVSGFCGTEDKEYTSSYLKNIGINPSFTPLNGKNRICVIINEISNSSETVINSECVFIMNNKSEQNLIKKIDSESKKASCCVLSGSLPLGCTRDFYRKLTGVISSNTKLICDTSGINLKTASKMPVFILKANKTEFEEAFKVRLAASSSINSFARKLVNKGPQTVIITLGNKGSLCFSKQEGFFSVKPAPGLHGMSAVGCGDAFNAGLAYGIDSGMNLEAGLKYATACAEANLMSVGSCFIHRTRIKALLTLVKIKKAPL